jgi:hypothetical protein
MLIGFSFSLCCQFHQCGLRNLDISGVPIEISAGPLQEV